MKYFLSLALLLFAIGSSAQEMGEQLLKLIVTEAKMNNGTDLTKHYTSNKTYLLVHKNKNESGLFFSNVMPGAGTKSYGKISELENKKGNNSEQLSFKWSYQNSYDSNRGESYIMIGLSYNDNPTSFLCMISLGDQKVLQLKGYVSK